MNIAICDDDSSELKRLKALLYHITSRLEHMVQIHTYSKSADLLFDIEENPRAFDILFLDMYIDERIGLDVARYVRSRNIQCGLVFITAFPDKMEDCFQYRTSGYLLKPVTEEKLECVLCTALQHFRERARSVFRLDLKDREVVIPYEKILYFESRLKTVYLYCSDGKEPLTFFAKLTGIPDLPTDYFYICHKSYIVNFLYVHELDKSGRKFILYNGREIPISRPYYSKALEAFTAFHSIKR
ncbi:LytR/AlgR family response regulator transcription factor [Ethanoligenens sp.]|uniref:LytR/AlgR family response regulator transcription factor n=1 Tax=Ethanoligenens sp. TaxID=2099655 RepID=UPI0039EC33C8